MVELNNAKKAGLVSLAMILSGLVTFVVTDEPSVFYCQERDLVNQCQRLSDSKVTCYLSDGSAKRCTGGWESITKYISENQGEIMLPTNETPYCTPELKYKVVCKI